MKKLKKLKMLLIATGMMASLSFLNCYAVPKESNTEKRYEELHQEKKGSAEINFQQHILEEDEDEQIDLEEEQIPGFSRLYFPSFPWCNIF